MKNEKPTFWDWVHLNRDVDFTRAQWLGGFTGALLFSAAVAIVLICLIGLWHLLGALLGYGPFGTDTTGGAIRNIGLVIAAAFSAPFLVWRSIVAQKNSDTAVQSQITDRINKAVEGLGAEKVVKKTIETPKYQKKDGKWVRDQDGNPKPALRPDGTPIIDREIHESSVPNLEVRIGAIYALERIAQDSLRDHLQIMEILCAYIRENAPVLDLEPTEPPFKKVSPRTDIQAAINVLGRRSKEQLYAEEKSKFRLDLRNADLSGVDFRNLNFTAARFHNCRLEAALFGGCNLTGTQFYGALLNFAEFVKAELRGTRFDFAVMDGPKMGVGAIHGAFSGGEAIALGDIYGISLIGTDLSAIGFLGEPADINLTIGSADTKLAPTIELNWKDIDKEKRFIRKLRNEDNAAEAQKREEIMFSQVPFASWVNRNSHDLTLPREIEKFQKRLGLEGWPYQS
ncbi:pentapeptide repeat protein [Pseudovibrio sp. FO-BEG1]|uniref:pentapeptide repeat-containing protein n=1 Tax=Pseudovibrio sp. (strain FO-BEG1) TaxID=911045 RepID=UPI000238D673|nr:pentapeptide repeat-containing protein [Pseudovibrio sp. FO-BEG1]AEV35857.1 pentapeptide repeat protein [Pseudovibrio sp. FO-BEG1]